MNKTYADQAPRLALARQLAVEAMVLLKNEDQLLPLPAGKTIALLGQTQLETILGGAGSGASQSEGSLQIREELAKAGLTLEPGLDGFYQELAQQRRQKAEKKQQDSRTGRPRHRCPGGAQPPERAVAGRGPGHRHCPGGHWPGHRRRGVRPPGGGRLLSHPLRAGAALTGLRPF